jgi:hypothetical protein
MGPEGSIPNSQELSTCPYPEPDQFSPHHPILLIQDPSSYYPPTYVLVFLVVSFPLAFPPTYTRSSSPPLILHAQQLRFIIRNDVWCCCGSIALKHIILISQTVTTSKTVLPCRAISHAECILRRNFWNFKPKTITSVLDFDVCILLHVLYQVQRFPSNATLFQ